VNTRAFVMGEGLRDLHRHTTHPGITSGLRSPTSRRGSRRVGVVRAVVQRVRSASVSVDDEVVGAIGPGLLALVGVTHDDDEAAAAKLAGKIANLRICADDDGDMNRSVLAAGGSVLVVSQFTLYGDTSRGRRPSWIEAARPEQAEPLVDAVVRALRRLEVSVETGRFGAHMQVELVNDGPVTLLLET
jgi:D-tyrosyl-tRNA(Tyr) deacylase